MPVPLMEWADAAVMINLEVGTLASSASHLLATLMWRLNITCLFTSLNRSPQESIRSPCHSCKLPQCLKATAGSLQTAVTWMATWLPAWVRTTVTGTTTTVTSSHSLDTPWSPTGGETPSTSYLLHLSLWHPHRVRSSEQSHELHVTSVYQRHVKC